jgi:hypothetical protein
VNVSWAMSKTLNAKGKRRGSEWFILPLVILLVPLILALVALAMLGWVASAIALHVLTLVVWLPTGRRVLFVYSDSPNWKSHIETEVLPRLPPKAVVLNWSQRSRWPWWSLSVWLFRFYAGTREYNPLAIVIRPWRGPKLFRFWKAFRDYKHGKVQTLQSLETSFFQSIEAS